MTTKKSKNTKEVSEKNPFEEPIGGLGSGIVKSFAKDFGQEGIHDMWDQLLGVGDFETTTRQFTGDLVEGEEFDLRTHLAKKHERPTPEKSKRMDAEPGINYFSEIINSEKRVSRQQERSIETKIQEILVELKRLVHTSAALQVEYREIAVEQRVVKAGKYYVSFFEWLLTVIRAARMRIEDSGAWLSTMKSKKGQKGYWAQFKKHGTSFGLSNERVVATQTG